jgi:hypothetical protein
VQLWLLDKLGALKAPLPGYELFPRHLVDRPMVFHHELAVDDWFAFLNDLQSEDIVWRCPWLNIPAMTLFTVGQNKVVIAGLDCFTFYIPGRIRRQLGRSQGYHRHGAEVFEMPVFDIWHLRNYADLWDNRVMREPNPGFRTWLENRYKRWLAEEMEARRRGFF